MRKTAKPRRPPVRRIRVSSISHSHKPDRRPGYNRPGWRYPIDIVRGWFGYQILDGNDRLCNAKEQHKTFIEGRVW